MIEAHLKKSIGREKALEPGVAAEKGLGAEERQYSRRFWQYGEDPSCCRSNAESYLIFPIFGIKIVAFGPLCDFRWCRAVLFAARFCFFHIKEESLRCVSFKHKGKEEHYEENDF